jgi:hypothetical protein
MKIENRFQNLAAVVGDRQSAAILVAFGGRFSRIHFHRRDAKNAEKTFCQETSAFFASLRSIRPGLFVAAPAASEKCGLRPLALASRPENPPQISCNLQANFGMNERGAT